MAASDLFYEITGTADYKTKCRLLIGKKNASVDQMNAYGEDVLWKLKTVKNLFPDNTPGVGYCVAGEIDLELSLPSASIPRQAKLIPQLCVTTADGSKESEYLSKGIYYLDTREKIGDSANKRLAIHGYDAMLMAEQDYPASKLDWPAHPYDVVKEICAFLGWELEWTTDNNLQIESCMGYVVQYPGEYSCRETLGYIAAMFGGVFMINEDGQLELVMLQFLMYHNKSGRVLGASPNRAITVGGKYIRV